VTPKHHTCDDAAGVRAPSGLEICTTRLMLHGLLSGSYRRFVDGMGLRGDERVLDYGSGSGAAARHLAKGLQAGGQLTCIDVSARWQVVIRRVLRDYPDVDFRLGDVRAMALPESMFDVVLVHWIVAPWSRNSRACSGLEGACSRASRRARSTACLRRRRARCTPPLA